MGQLHYLLACSMPKAKVISFIATGDSVSIASFASSSAGQDLIVSYPEIITAPTVRSKHKVLQLQSITHLNSSSKVVVGMQLIERPPTLVTVTLLYTTTMRYFPQLYTDHSLRGFSGGGRGAREPVGWTNSFVADFEIARNLRRASGRRLHDAVSGLTEVMDKSVWK